LKRKENLEPLKEAIDRFLKDHRLSAKYKEKALAHYWAEMMGDVIARKTQSVKLNNKCMTVKLESSVLRQELSYAKDKLIADINKKFEEELIDSIEFKA